MRHAMLLAKSAVVGLYLAMLVVVAADTRKSWTRDSHNNCTQFWYT